MKKKILIVTERRADYSKFRPVIKEIENSSKLDYFLIVTGSHLLKEHGNTLKDIKKDGFKITAKFQMYSRKKDDTGFEMVSAFGKSIIELSKLVKKLNPDIILSGFDIGANFASAIIGAHMNKIVIHIEGGEVSGTIDDPIRHATTRFAHIHYVTNSSAARRIIRMGENPKYVHVVGNPSLDSIRTVKKIPKHELEKEFDIDLSKPLVLILQHTVTTELDSIQKNFRKTLDAVKELNVQAILIYGNADAGSKQISQIIKHSKIKQYSTLSFEKYINLLKNSSVLVGNSSSGIMEAPFLHVPSIDIGSRQSKRLQSSSVIDVDYDKNKIKKVIIKAIYDKQFLEKCKKTKSLYGEGHSAKKIVKLLENLDIKKIPIQKQLFY
ncbi:UDP-N-acetylglucosamine 2-epimerase [Nitrosopumilus sp.]|uniref:UDP-N-acetylglucosamine 2-epimerase n=1 Tax=Nitrosopumilus sp. TaxID=2024843 RepID=UPI00242FE32F|nr:UDP-N-acetylglucosamine 2-epimerase [Nitrosopumilus sp.]MCV0366618.1 UDP-N-acetylglucosamine 2-epimerase (hydrolyzing) [Nitrosopumilus sp.]MCV0410541.1 UDP-N-acetylglucosamine 2-epimerase (hydrolyzing) [Nitrosopumilus sp.]